MSRGRVEEVFLEITRAPAAERNALLEARCNGDDRLKAEVLSLLEHFVEDESSFLNHAELEVPGLARKVLEEEPVLQPGSRLAGFTIGGIIGSGGMGVVYVAEQERPRRTVALKVIRRGLAAPAILRRFEHEAEVLGRLQHPGIAQVYEAGFYDVSTGVASTSSPLVAAAMHQNRAPYIAMELVKGPSLTEYANRQNLDTRGRMAVLARVCEAVQHAHRRGVIHRDLKPGNILVDESGQPKILDFGVARATGADARVTLQTGAGQLIGTLAYMSPEQMLADPTEVDTRADVYALGVIMYELLTGRLPHDLDKHPLPEAARVIRDESPQRPGSVVRSLRGEVETIMLKALAKDRRRRYQSAADLEQDLRRFLDGRPIAAKDDSAFYVLRKQLKRHGGLVTAASVVLVLLVAFAIYASIQSRRNEKLAQSEAKAKNDALVALQATTEAQSLADQTSKRLREELITSTVERGRLLGLAGNLAAAEALLWPMYLRDPTSRQTHWALWELYSHQPCLATVQAHEGSVNGLLISPDERVMYSGGADGVIRVWDPETAHPISQFEGTRPGIFDMAMTPDGGRIVAALADGQVVVWDTATRKEALRIAAHSAAAHGVAFSPDATRLATCGDDRLVRLWDAQTGAHIADMPTSFRSPVGRVTFSPDGKWIAAIASFSDGRAMLWDAGSTVIEVTRHQGGASAVTFSPDSSVVVTAGWDRQIRLWDIKERRIVGKLLSPNGYVQSLHYGDGGRTLYSTGWWTVDTWDVANLKRTRAFSLRITGPTSVFWKNGTMIAAGLMDGTVQFWDAAPSPGQVRLTGHMGRTAGTLSPDGRIAATGDQEGVVRLWDAHTGTLLATLPAHKARVKSLRFSPDGTMLATGAEDSVAILWDLRTGATIGSVNRHRSQTDDALNFSPDGRRLSVIRTNYTISLLRVPDLTEEQVIPATPTEVIGARFSPDGQSLAAITRDRVIRVWPLAGGDALELKSKGESIPWSVAFSPDGSRMVIGDWAKDVQLWRTSDWKQLDAFHGHSALVASVEFNPAEPDMVASSALDGVVRLWDVRTGLTLATLDSFDGWDALSLAVSRDGRRIMTTGATEEGVIWDLRYFDRHIAWNAERQIRLLGESSAPAFGLDLVRRWAAAAMAGPPSDPPATGDVTPDLIAAWGRFRQ